MPDKYAMDHFVNVSTDTGSNWITCTLSNDDPTIYQATITPAEDPNVWIKFDSGMVHFENNALFQDSNFTFSSNSN